jgi:photosystem II stability/assembly factor-like uncharacterized protein
MVSSSDEPLWVPTNGSPGGAFRIIEFNPGDPDLMYAGSGYTFFRSEDGGDTWIRVNQLHALAETLELGVWALEFDPIDPDILYLGFRGGVFKSTDAGVTWTRKTGMFEGLCVQAITVDPVEPDIVYFLANHGDDENFVYKSLNGGDSWTDISSSLPSTYAMSMLKAVRHNELYTGGGFEMARDGELFHSTDGGASWEVIDIGQGEDTFPSRVIVDPHDGDHIYIGFGDAYNRGRWLEELLFESFDGGETWQPVRHGEIGSGVSDLEISKSDPDLIYYLSPLHRSTDGGLTWERIHTWNQVDDFGRVEQNNIAIHPKDENILFATLMGQGVAKSTDAGKTWKLSTKGMVSTFVTNVATDPVDPDTVYVSGGDGSGTWKTTDGGQTWTVLNKGGIFHPWVDELTIVPSDPNVIYDIADVGLIFKSEDAGETWVEWNNGFHHESIYALEVDPVNPDVIYAMNNGFGMFKSENGGENWHYLLYSPDYSYSIAIDPSNTSIIYSGYNRKVFENASRVYRSTEAGESWEAVLEIPGSRAVTSVAVDPKNPSRIYAAATGDEGEIYFTGDKGETWEKLNDHFTMCTVWGQPQLIVDPNDPSTAYAATWLAGTWKTTNAGENWTLLRDAPVSATALSLDGGNGDIIYLADRSSPTVWKSTDSGNTWSKVADFAADGALLVMRVYAHDDDVYASTFHPSLRGGRLYKSADGGQTWADITGALPPGILDVAVDPSDPDTVYLTTNINGAYKSLDDGMTWGEMEAFPDVGAYDIEVDPDDPQTLYASARGGSLPGWFTSIAGIPEGVEFSDGAGVYKSSDAGESWSKLLDTSISCRVIRRHPDHQGLFFSTDLVDGPKMSSDGGGTWTSLREGLNKAVVTSVAVAGDKIYVGTQGCGVYSGDLDVEKGEVTWRPTRSNKPVPAVHNLRVEVDPTDSDTVYVASYPGGLFVSSDGGVTFRDRNGITPSVPVTDPLRQYYSFAVDPSTPGKMWVGTWGKGVYKSYNSMILNIPMNLYGKHINYILVDPRNSSTVYVAAREGIYVTRDDGESWAEMSKGMDTGDTAFLAISGDGRLLAGSKGYGVYSYDEDAERWVRRKVENFGVYWHVWDRPLYLYNALLVNPFDPDIMYLGTFPTGFYRTIDGGLTWQEINVNFTIDGAFSMAFHPYNKSVIFAGTYNGISRSDDCGDTWRRWDKGMPPELWVFSIVFDPSDHDIVYAAAKNGENKGTGRDGYRGTVLKSIDGGANWFEIAQGLNLNDEYYQLVMYPYNYDILFVSSASGVYMTENAGETWAPINDGLEVPGGIVSSGIVNNVANNLAIDAEGRHLYLGTIARGVFKADLEKLDLENDPEALPLSCFNYVQNGDETGIDTGGSCAIDDREYDYGLAVKLEAEEPQEHDEGMVDNVDNIPAVEPDGGSEEPPAVEESLPDTGEPTAEESDNTGDIGEEEPREQGLPYPMIVVGLVAIIVLLTVAYIRK